MMAPGPVLGQQEATGSLGAQGDFGVTLRVSAHSPPGGLHPTPCHQVWADPAKGHQGCSRGTITVPGARRSWVPRTSLQVSPPP